MQKRLNIRNEIGELSRVNLFLEKSGKELGLSAPFLMKLTLVMEEAISNIIFYAYAEESRDEEINILLERKGKMLIITLTDAGQPFDPTLKKDPDITLAAEDRPIGGLGVYLIRQLMDEVAYKRENNLNVLIMKKNITA